MSRTLHVLVVDDSAVVRQLLTALLASEPDLTAAAAADPYIALRKMAQARPDVIVLDLEMPRMDGLTFLRRVMREDPIPVVVCSGHAERGTDTALRALEEGAVEVIARPKVGVREFLHESAVRLIDAVRAAAEARLGRPALQRIRPHAAARRAGPRLVLPTPCVGVSSSHDRPGRPPVLVAIGASTGGPQALQQILEQMPVEGRPPALGAAPGIAPGIVIVQHMPEGFTAAFARRLDATCRIEVREARDGDPVLPGRALIAPGDRHLLVVPAGEGYAVEVRDGPLVSRHRPSVDVLFRSVARAAGPQAVGVLLTGMGADGAEGLLEMKQAGAATLAQSEATCVVFGMPREAIARGAADEVVALPDVARAVLRLTCGPAGSAAATR